MFVIVDVTISTSKRGTRKVTVHGVPPRFSKVFKTKAAANKAADRYYRECVKESTPGRLYSCRVAKLDFGKLKVSRPILRPKGGLVRNFGR